jgi:hypothetical protein
MNYSITQQNIEDFLNRSQSTGGFATSHRTWASDTASNMISVFSPESSGTDWPLLHATGFFQSVYEYSKGLVNVSSS